MLFSPFSALVPDIFIILCSTTCSIYYLFCAGDLPDFIPTQNNRQIKDAEKPCNNFA
jgi:hypothetical protein